jgi:hypothetical protein
MEPVPLEGATNAPIPSSPMPANLSMGSQGLMQVASQGPFGVTASPLSQRSNNSEKRDENDYNWLSNSEKGGF